MGDSEMDEETEFDHLLKERGWTIKEIRSYFTGNKLVALINQGKGIEGTLELTESELRHLNKWAYWKALAIEAETLKEGIYSELHKAFEAAAVKGIDLMFLVPEAWYTAQQLEEERLGIFAELRATEREVA